MSVKNAAAVLRLKIAARSLFYTYHKEQVISRCRSASTQSIAITRAFDTNSAELAGKVVQTRQAGRTTTVADQPLRCHSNGIAALPGPRSSVLAHAKITNVSSIDNQVEHSIATS